MLKKHILGVLVVLGLLTLRAAAQLTVDDVVTNGLFEPYGVAVSFDNTVFVTDSANQRVVQFDPNSGVVTTLAGILGESGSNDGPPYLAHFSSPQGIALATVGGAAGLIIGDTGNHLIRFVNLTNGWVTTLAGTAGVAGNLDAAIGTNAKFRSPIGVAVDAAGILYVADSQNNVIRQINLADPNFGVTTLAVSGTTFRQPNDVTVLNTNQLWVADTRNHAIKLITRTGPASATLTTLMGSNDQGITGATDSSFGPSARFNNPRGVLWLGAAGLVIADTGNQTLRLATNNPVFGLTNYGVITFAGIAGQSGYVNGPALAAKFSGPHGLARDSLGSGFLIADTANSAIRRIQTGLTQPPVDTPQIGWVDFPPPLYRSVLRTDQPFVFNNNVIVAILSEQATETFFTFGPTPPSPVEDQIPSPSRLVGATPPSYRNGLLESEVNASIISPQPDVTVKAIGTQDGRRSSAIATARFQFKTANPIINGDNAASFTVSSATIGAVLWYTTDGTDPTDAPPSVGPISNPSSLSLILTNSNLKFKIRAFRDHYKSSDVVAKDFSETNFIPNRISFGLTNGEPTSAFLARPGQFFYAPVTLQLQPGGDTMYSLQFNVAVTNGWTNLNTGIRPPPIQNGAGLGFFSMLMSSVPKEVADHNPPPSFDWFLTLRPFLMDAITNDVGFSLFTNYSNNLLGVGWLYRPSFHYFVFDVNTFQYLLDFDTTKHDLIRYSIAHDTLFNKANGVVVLGAYSFQVPNNATNGDVYRIQLGSPSATRDGVGAPASEIYIRPPASSQAVTVGAPSYVVGDVAPFRWLNAGDFGDLGEGYLNNADVMQVFQTAILGLHTPPENSDLFRAMDSSGTVGTFDPTTGYFTDSGKPPANIQALFDGNDLTINCVAFGDGVLDVTDVFVTFRRSLDPSLAWFRRFWTNGQFAAVTISNLAFNTIFPTNGLAQCNAPVPLSSANPPFAYEQAAVSFTAGDGVVAAGGTVQIPISVQTAGSYPLRVLGLNLTVHPLEGSPGVTQPVQFTPASALGQPTFSASKNAANFSGAWLSNSIPGLGGNALLGTLTITVPTNGTATSAYAIHFDHASASPNGLASFPKHTQTGLLTFSDRSASSWHDGIPDSWRLRYFGSVSNILSQADADADGDGASNMQEYKTGTDPNDASSVLRLKSQSGQPRECVIRWPSVSGKQYVLERAASIFSPSWTPVSTNAGTGGEMQFHDPGNSSAPRFYRVRLLE